MKRFNTAKEVYSYLDSIPVFSSEGESAANFDLSRFRKFCSKLGNPQQKWSAVHIAGTNGKGSTARLAASVYQQAGYTVGLYTSPHLLSYKERFRINGQEIDDNALINFFNENIKLIEDYALTYFEISTAVAFWWFTHQKVDLAVIEVGLGGRLDATNLVNPAVSVITTVSLDHTDILGDTLKEIAWEKAGIIKEQVPVVVGQMKEVAAEAIRKQALSKKAPFHDLEELELTYKDGKLGLLEDGRYRWLDVSLHAAVQAQNIGLVRQVVRVLDGDFPVSWQQFRQGIEQSARLNPNPAHFEKLHPSVEWYFDGAHNTQAFSALHDMVTQKKSLADTVLVFSVMVDKMTPDMNKMITSFGSIYYYPLETKRAADFDFIRKNIPKARHFPTEKHTQDNWFKEFESELVIFAGSFYFYSTVREWIARFTLNR